MIPVNISTLIYALEASILLDVKKQARKMKYPFFGGGYTFETFTASFNDNAYLGKGCKISKLSYCNVFWRCLFATAFLPNCLLCAVFSGSIFDGFVDWVLKILECNISGLFESCFVSFLAYSFKTQLSSCWEIFLHACSLLIWNKFMLFEFCCIYHDYSIWKSAFKCDKKNVKSLFLFSFLFYLLISFLLLNFASPNFL